MAASPLPQDKSATTDVSVFEVVLLAVFFVGLLVVTTLALLQAWPTATTAGVLMSPKSSILGFHQSFSSDQDLFFVVALSGALGGELHVARSLASYVGQGSLRRRWLLYYFTLPLIGSGLALLFYFLLRGGLLEARSGSSLNPYGLAAIAALVGLFSIQAVEMLQSVFNSIFAKAKEESDPLRDKIGEDGPAS